MAALLAPALALLLVSLQIITPATAKHPVGETGEQRRRSLQQAASPKPCRWEGDTPTSSTSYKGGCVPNVDYLASKWPTTLAGYGSLGSTCGGIFAPTALNSLKDTDVPKIKQCYQAGQQGQLCYVDFDPTTEQLSCTAPVIWTGALSAFAGCPGSVQGNYRTCTFLTRDKCTKGAGARGVCVNTFNTYLKQLTTAQRTALAKYLGGSSLPWLRDIDSCKPATQWAGATMDPKWTFARINQEFGTYVSSAIRNSQDIGTNCPLGRARVKQIATEDACTAVKLPANPDNSADTTVAGPSLADCLNTPYCEVYWGAADQGDGTTDGEPTAICRSSPGVMEGLFYSADATDTTVRTQIAYLYNACYAPSNRNSQKNCEAEQAYPVV